MDDPPHIVIFDNGTVSRALVLHLALNIQLQLIKELDGTHREDSELYQNAGPQARETWLMKKPKYLRRLGLSEERFSRMFEISQAAFGPGPEDAAEESLIDTGADTASDESLMDRDAENGGWRDDHVFGDEDDRTHCDDDQDAWYTTDDEENDQPNTTHDEKQGEDCHNEEEEEGKDDSHIDDDNQWQPEALFCAPLLWKVYMSQIGDAWRVSNLRVRVIEPNGRPTRKLIKKNSFLRYEYLPDPKQE